MAETPILFSVFGVPVSLTNTQAGVSPRPFRKVSFFRSKSKSFSVSASCKDMFTGARG